MAQEIDATTSAQSVPVDYSVLDDSDLISLARSGNTDAFAVLYTRYAYVATRLARHLAPQSDADDIVAESFAQVLDQVRRGKGPEKAFRAYLFTAVRHEAGRKGKARQRVMPTDDLATIDSVVPFRDGQLDDYEKSIVRAAYESLPARWRTVLWHLDVEGRKPHELGPLLGLKPNSVSALVYRARAGLREAYLQQHLQDDAPGTSRTCRDVRPKLSGVVRRTLSMREQEKVHAHLDTCRHCMGLYLELQEVNRSVGAYVAPALLVAAAVEPATSLALLAGKGLLALKIFAVASLQPVAATAAASGAVVAMSGMTVGLGTAAAEAPAPPVVVAEARSQPAPSPPAPAPSPSADAPDAAPRQQAADLPAPAPAPEAPAPQAVEQEQTVVHELIGGVEDTVSTVVGDTPVPDLLEGVDQLAGGVLGGIEPLLPVPLLNR